MKAVLGIAAYRSPSSVLDLVATATSAQGRQIFDRIQIVDSHGDGSIQQFVARQGLAQRVEYYNAEVNLGAAGNLDKRLSWAADSGAQLLFAINADGHLDLSVAEGLLDYATRTSCGAAYPARRLADNCYEYTGTLPFPWRSVRRSEDELPEAESVPVYWSSSNAAVYSLHPVRQGIRPPTGLWHGWEDLAFGLLLRQAGYEQRLLPALRIESRYDVRALTHSSVAPDPYRHISDKQPWLAYYSSRNLLLIATRVLRRPAYVVAALSRISVEALMTLLFRNRKLDRLRYLFKGVADGVRGRQGMVVEPRLDD